MKYEINTFDRLLLGIETMAVHLVSGLLSLYADGYTASYGGSAALTVILRIVTVGIVPPLLLAALIRSVPGTHFEAGGGRLLWLRKGLSYLLPGEAARFAFNLLPLSLNRFGLIFGQAAQYLFTASYVRASGRYDEIFKRGHLTGTDTLAYAGCYALYLLVWLAAELAIYRFFWNRRAEEHEEMMHHGAASGTQEGKK